jgi:hypothetical protein
MDGRDPFKKIEDFIDLQDDGKSPSEIIRMYRLIW